MLNGESWVYAVQCGYKGWCGDICEDEQLGGAKKLLALGSGPFLSGVQGVSCHSQLYILGQGTQFHDTGADVGLKSITAFTGYLLKAIDGCEVDGLYDGL